MELRPDMTLAQFRDEMQLRAVKFSTRSRPVREALAFARGQANPEFLRLALEKIHAQEQYRRQTEGPSRWEWLADRLQLVSLREIGITLALVGAAYASIEGVRLWWRSAQAPHVSNAELERLARRLGYSTAGPSAAKHSTPADANQSTAQEPMSPQLAAHIEALVARRIEERLAQRAKTAEAPQIPPPAPAAIVPATQATAGP